MGQPGVVTTVDFHFDVMCPYAYQTSIWMREVRDLVGVEVRWRFFSLEEVNRAKGKKHPWEREWSYGWSMMRIGALLRRSDMDALDRWYEGAGRALHIEGRKPHERSVAREILADLGLEQSGLERLIELAREGPTAVMCAETLWWRCHRRLLADALLAAGCEVHHLLEGGPRPHELHPSARVEDGRPVYDAGTRPRLDPR